MDIRAHQEQAAESARRRASVRRSTAMFPAAACLVASTAAAASDSRCAFIDLAPAPLADSLDALARQTGINVVYRPEDVADAAAPSVAGACDANSALRELLHGAKLSATDVGGVYVITARASALDEPAERVRTAPSAQDGAQPSDEIVVTGTMIRGAAPIGSPLITLDREEMRRRGAATVQDALATLPQSLGAGPNETTAGVAGTAEGGANFNFAFGSSVNLRGLGPDKTLTLVNGRRLAPGGIDGAFVDLSLIPLSAVERIETLTDGASALYGSDAIGGVVNIILRSDYDGADTRLRGGTVFEGGFKDFQFGQVAGKNWSSGSVLAAYEYFRQAPLAAADRPFAASSDLTSLGGDNFNLPGFGHPGTLIAAGQSFALPAGTAGTANSTNRREGSTLLPRQDRHSVFGSASQEIGDHAELFLDGAYSSRRFHSFSAADVASLIVPASNPFFIDPVGGQPFVIVQYNFFEEYGPLKSAGRATARNWSAGGRLDLGDWRVEAAVSEAAQNARRTATGLANRPALAAALADPDPVEAFNPFTDAAGSAPDRLAALAGFVRTSTRSSVRTASLKADGALFDLPGGAAKLAIGGEYRRDAFASARVDFQDFALPTQTGAVDLDRHVAAGYAELAVPLVGADNARPGVRKLDLSAALRYERHNDFGGSANPKFGARYEPVDGLSLRAAYGKSFRAPLLTEINPEDLQIFASPFPDPASPTGVSTVLFLLGANPDLEPEKARTLSAGVDIGPDLVAGLSASATFFSIDLENRIDTLDVFSALSREQEFAGAVTRNPDPQIAQGFLDHPLANDFGLGLAGSDIDIILDGRVANTARTKIHGLDGSVAYERDLGAGAASVGVDASYIFDFLEAFSPSSPLIETVDTLGRQPDFRARFHAAWRSPAVNASLFVNYTDGYRDDVSAPPRRVKSWTSVDLSLAADLSTVAARTSLSGLRATFFISNLFDAAPPFANNPNGAAFDPNNANPRGRYAALEIDKSW